MRLVMGLIGATTAAERRRLTDRDLGVRWRVRRLHRYQPFALMAVFAALVAVTLVVDLVPWFASKWLERQAKDREIAAALLEHLVVAALVAAAAYYWVIGLKLQRALKAYSRLARKHPRELVSWSAGTQLDVRSASAERLASGIARSPTTAVSIVHGRLGSGRASFLVALVEQLATHGLLPVALWAPREGLNDIAGACRKVFCDRIAESVSSDEQADRIWRRAWSSRDVVVLLDGLDDDFLETLSSEDPGRLEHEVEELRAQGIAVVLATTQELQLGDTVALREDLDLYSREEAEEYVGQAAGRDGTAMSALALVHDPVDDFLIAPFYLDLIVRLQKAGVALGDLPEHRDRWRGEVLNRYVMAVCRGSVVPRPAAHDADNEDAGRRARAAVHAAIRVARMVDVTRGELAVSTRALGVAERVLADASELNLLWHGKHRVGFAADDLGALLIARTTKDPENLLAAIRHMAQAPTSRGRWTRALILTLMFWHFGQGEGRRVETAGRLLDDMERNSWTRPALASAAVRIVSTCELDEFAPRVERIVHGCIDAVLAPDGDRHVPAWYSRELMPLVRALADWPTPEAQRLLWRLATSHNVEVEWPAAKGLALAQDRLADELAREVDNRISDAEKRSGEELSRKSEQEDLGNEVASLACILPSLRGPSEHGDEETRFGRVRDLCLKGGISPLRGEMSLAQGLKLAVLNDRSTDKNVAEIQRLLFSPDSFPRFWQTRLVLLQALLWHAWDGDGARRGALTSANVQELRKRESHPLVQDGIRLVGQALTQREKTNDGRPQLSRYMWTHERDAVRWVARGREDTGRLAADTVLLSNMIYELWRRDPEKADATLELSGLPACIRKCGHRDYIIEGGCSCAFGLCTAPREPTESPILDLRAPFSEGFCREQSRLAAQLGKPRWTRPGAYGSTRKLQRFWDRQAAAVAGDNRSPSQ